MENPPQDSNNSQDGEGSEGSNDREDNTEQTKKEIVFKLAIFNGEEKKVGEIELTEEELKALQGELEDLNKEEEAAVEESEEEEKRNKANLMSNAANGNGEITLRKIEKPGMEKRISKESKELTEEEKKLEIDKTKQTIKN